MADHANRDGALAGAGDIDQDAAFRAAVAIANIPTLLMVLVQLTGDTRWLEPPYAPERGRGLDDNDDGGLPDDVQAEIRAAATEALLRAPREIAAWGPVGLYAGWVSAAAGVAMGAVLSGYGVLSPQIAALAILVVLSLVGVAVIWVCPAAPSYLFSLCWAYMGVIVAGLEPLRRALGTSMVRGWLDGCVSFSTCRTHSDCRTHSQHTKLFSTNN